MLTLGAEWELWLGAPQPGGLGMGPMPMVLIWILGPSGVRGMPCVLSKPPLSWLLGISCHPNSRNSLDECVMQLDPDDGGLQPSVAA